ncbi:a-factor receptor [Pleurotus pulmonarius]|nr:a-factor receptor [Pleurotus pulmonarius]
MSTALTPKTGRVILEVKQRIGVELGCFSQMYLVSKDSHLDLKLHAATAFNKNTSAAQYIVIVSTERTGSVTTRGRNVGKELDEDNTQDEQSSSGMVKVTKSSIKDGEATRLTVGISVAIPAAALCIYRRLYKIASVQTVALSPIGLGIPFTQMALQIIVQGHRYDIWEDVGCLPRTFNTPPAYPLSFLWPLVIALISAVYCILTLRAFMIRRAQFRQFLSANSSLTMNRYFRLMALATVELVINTSLNAYGTYLTISSNTIQPWRGWDDAHFDWYLVDTFPAVLWRMSTRNIISLEMGRWSVVFCSILFFAFFGFADEARKNYKIAYFTVCRVLRIPTKSKLVSMDSFQSFTLPSDEPTSEDIIPTSAPVEDEDELLKQLCDADAHMPYGGNCVIS